MIYTVTFNPAIDYVVRLDRELAVGDVNRAKGEDCVLGGKGINVSGVLAQLGCESDWPSALWQGDRCVAGARPGRPGLKNRLRPISATAMTRINVKIKAGQETELNGAGPEHP